MSEKQVKTYRLNRLFNLCDPREYGWLIFINFVLIILEFFFAKESIPVIVSTLVFVNVLFVVGMITHSPKMLSFHGEEIEFDQYVCLKPNHSGFFTSRGIVWWRKVHYTVPDVKQMELRQNFIERIFDVGHVSFKGKARWTAKKDLDRIKEKDTFTIYGIPHFSLFRAEMSRNLHS